MARAQHTFRDWSPAYFSLFSLLIFTFDSFYQVLNTLRVTVKEALFIGGVIMVFFTYSVAGVILPSLTTKYVAKSMMVRRRDHY